MHIYKTSCCNVPRTTHCVQIDTLSSINTFAILTHILFFCVFHNAGNSHTPYSNYDLIRVCCIYTFFLLCVITVIRANARIKSRLAGWSLIIRISYMIYKSCIYGNAAACANPNYPHNIVFPYLPRARCNDAHAHPILWFLIEADLQEDLYCGFPIQYRIQNHFCKAFSTVLMKAVTILCVDMDCILFYAHSNKYNKTSLFPCNISRSRIHIINLNNTSGHRDKRNDNRLYCSIVIMAKILPRRNNNNFC